VVDVQLAVAKPELRERAVRMVAEVNDQHGSEWAAISEVAGGDAGSVERLDDLTRHVANLLERVGLHGQRPGLGNVAAMKSPTGHSADVLRNDGDL
jgi:hypothetical protein